jgi:Holliday junction resolvase RusA-like endonuclease
MGIDIESIKNPHLREKLLQKRNAARNCKVAPAVAAPTPEPSVSPSTIIEPEPQKSTEIFFKVAGEPMGKPRMTQRDKWQKRPCVIRYRLYCDKIREAAGKIPENPLAVHIKAFVGMPPSWSKKKKLEMIGQRHRARPDWDNIGKAICDALFEEDSCIAVGIAEKFWCLEGHDRTEVLIIYDESVLSRYGIGITRP